MKQLILAVILAATSTSLLAADVNCKAGLILGSYHYDREADYEETNPGIYGTCNQWTLGTFKNSYKDDSIFIAYESVPHYQRGRLIVTSIWGAADGYEDNPDAIGDEYSLIIGVAIKWNVFKTITTPSAIVYGIETK